MYKTVLFLSACCLLGRPFAAPTSPQLAERATTCTFTEASQVVPSKAACTIIILDNIAVPAGQTLDLTGLSTGTKVIFKGRTTWGFAEWAGPLVSVSGTTITVTSSPGAILDGQGALWWDGKGSNGGKTKPKFFFAHKMLHSSISKLYIKNSPVQAFSINNAQDLKVVDVTIDDSDGDTQGGHNTDAFDVGSSDSVEIVRANVTNQDDCLAINSGSNIVFTGGFCSGGHGLSIGSVGSGDSVSGVIISNNVVQNSDNGVRIKTIYGQTGSVHNVTYHGITLSNIRKYGIVIEQDYENGSPTGIATNGVPITDLVLFNVHGNILSTAIDKYVLCGRGSCSDWTWVNVDITGGETSTLCSNAPNGISC